MNQTQEYNYSKAQDKLPFWIADYAGKKSRVVLLRLPNIAHQEDAHFHPTQIYIDASIAPLIQELNDKGYITTHCCSGLEEDHEEIGYGYITFVGKCLLSVDGALILPFKNGEGIYIVTESNQVKKEFWAAAYAQALRLEDK